ncbi:hypothetical protein NA56DRAFT_695023 [Hyaloscypha hepaticicola]|uniref:Uncharacterized protein n=1 Tax=Hyaloscypha hepaticicola TaxID=2082293 RepID=A0A2J6PGP8_9HELO|nr:hypothetical protein NA56DRAFT_695023 [Hyaloscypha hepaticicola]
MSLASGSRKKLRGYYGVPEQAIPQSQVAHFNPFVFDVLNKTTPELGNGENHEIKLPTYEQVVQSEIPSTDYKPRGHLSKWWRLYLICALIVTFCTGIVILVIKKPSLFLVKNQSGRPLPNLWNNGGAGALTDGAVAVE